MVKPVKPCGKIEQKDEGVFALLTVETDDAQREIVVDLEIAVATQEKFLSDQLAEPVRIFDRSIWTFKGNLYSVESETQRLSDERIKLLVKKEFYEGERRWQRLEDHISILEGAKVSSSGRKAIPESVRRAVWQRDNGKCVECGSNEKLEYDHIIAWSRGGSDTERNLRLLCEPCNRRKSSSI